jgi:hypothetical protein
MRKQAMASLGFKYKFLVLLPLNLGRPPKHVEANICTHACMCRWFVF